MTSIEKLSIAVQFFKSIMSNPKRRHPGTMHNWKAACRSAGIKEEELPPIPETLVCFVDEIVEAEKEKQQKRFAKKRGKVPPVVA